MTEHMTEFSKLVDFTLEMRKQLKLHENEKTGLKSWPLDAVWSLFNIETKNRLEIINNLGPEEMEKQCVHIANYCFFLWQKLQEAKTPQ